MPAGKMWRSGWPEHSKGKYNQNCANSYRSKRRVRYPNKSSDDEYETIRARVNLRSGP